MSLPREFIMLHHSWSTDNKVTSSWAAIETFHTSYRHGGDIITADEYLRLRMAGTPGLDRPWSDIGYHAGVEYESGRVVAHLGRSWLERAAACPQGDMNTRALHVCVVGNYDLGPPTLEVLDVLVKRVLRPWMGLFRIPASRIVGHRDFNPSKSCPGTAFDIALVRSIVA